MSLGNENRVFGWQPGLPDVRDFKYDAIYAQSVALPESVNLKGLCPATVYDQGNIGSCTAQALAAMYECLCKKNGIPTFTPSRLFIYWNERFYEGDVEHDTGAVIADGMKVLQKLGAPRESLWWYNPSKFAVKPNQGVFKDGALHKCGMYMKLDNTDLNQLKNCLYTGFPFVMGFTAFSSFVSDDVALSGMLTFPKKGESSIGGHAVLCVGYDNSKGAFLMRNSWGPKWGQQGYFYMPYSYVTNPNLCDDFWMMRQVS